MRGAARACLLTAAAAGAAGHGSMITPPPRSVGGTKYAVPGATGGTKKGEFVYRCPAGECLWFSQGCTIGCPTCYGQNKSGYGSYCGIDKKPTVNDPKHRTFNRANKPPTKGSPSGPPSDVSDWTAQHPWRAPGSAGVFDPCGVAGGSPDNNDPAGGMGSQTIAGKQGFPGSKLPPVEYKTVWTAGSTVEVEWSYQANHGGGYQYRLCPSSSPLTEACFQQHPLAWVGGTTTLRFDNGTTAEVPATRVSEGTLPAGSAWTMMPIPACMGPQGGYAGQGCRDGPQFPPPPGCDDTCWGYQPCTSSAGNRCAPGFNTTCSDTPTLKDRVLVPKDLAPGEYVIGFRWDTEHNPQVWASCGDVTVRAA